MYLLYLYSTAWIREFILTTSSAGTSILFVLVSNITAHVGLQNVFEYVLFIRTENL